jgi:hypothetical protein
MTKRPVEGSSLLPKSSNGNLEYFQFSMYQDQAASDQHRVVEYREGWCWGPTFKTYLDAPLENERFDVIAGVTRDDKWGQAMDVARVDDPD